MKNNNINQHVRNLILLYATAALLSITSIILVIEKVQATTTSSSSVIPRDNNNDKTTNSLGLIVPSPFYESNVGKVISQRIVSTEANSIAPQIEQSIIENGTIKGVGNVTNIGTWTNTFRSPGISYGVGQGIITTAYGQDMATWTAYDVGRSNFKGVILYHGISFF